MKRFYYLMAALVLMPSLAFAQDVCIPGNFIVTTPDPIAGDYDAATTSDTWGDTTGLLPPGTSGTVVIGRDPGGGDTSADPDEGCVPFDNPDELAGNIALIRRGACEFGLKGLNAQNAGAIGFIVYMDEREPDDSEVLLDPPFMGAGANGIEVIIPGVFISRVAGLGIVSRIEDFEDTVEAAMLYDACYLGDIANEDTGVVESREISAAYPNPFTERTQFDLTLEEAQEVSVRVYNVLGQEVAVLHDGLLPAGAQQTFTFESATLPAGVYLYRVVGETFASTRQVTLVR